MHCFTGSAAELRDYAQRGYYVGLTGFVAMRERGAALRANPDPDPYPYPKPSPNLTLILTLTLTLTLNPNPNPNPNQAPRCWLPWCRALAL